AHQCRAVEEVHLRHRAVRVCGGGGNIDRSRDYRVVDRGGDADGGRRVDDRAHGAGGRDRAVVVGGARGQRVRSGGRVGERDSVRRGGRRAHQRRAVEEVDLRHRAVRVVGGRGDVHRGRRIHRDIDGGGGRDGAVAVGRLRGQGIGPGRDVGPVEAVRGSRVRADQRRAAEEFHLGNGSVRVGRGGRE